MNQKVLKYGLITGVALVWGLIVYRVVSGLGGDDPVKPNKPLAVDVANYTAASDTFSLFADYPDPFLPGEEEVVDTILKTNIAPQAPIAPAPPPVDISFIQYHGMIYNPVKKMKTALLSIRNKEVMFREKQTTEEVKVLKIWTDKVTLVYKGKLFTVVKKE